MKKTIILFLVSLFVSFTFFNFPANEVSAAEDYNPAMVYDPGNNRFLVVFERDNGGQRDIIGQLINPNGTPFGSEIYIATTSENQKEPAVAYGNGVFLVTWDDYRNGTDADIYGQVVDVGGTLSGDNFPVSDSSAQFKSLSAIDFDAANNRFMVVWGDWRNRYTTHFDIYGQLVGAAGQLLLRSGATGSDNFPICQVARSQQAPAVAHDSVNGQYLVVWHDWRVDDITTDIYGQRVDAGDGSMLGSNFVVSNGNLGQAYPSVAYDPGQKRFLAVWYDLRSNSTYDVYGQFVNHDGSLFGTASDANLVISDAVSHQYAQSLAYDSANQRFLITWSDSRSGTSDIYGQYVNAAGTLNGANFVISDANGGQDSPSVAYNSADGNFLTAFVSDESGTRDIAFAVVSPPGCTPPPSGMVSWWGGDNNALDMVGGHNGTLMGNATYASGKVGQAFSLDGAFETYIEVPNTSVFNPVGAFSVDGWFYIDPEANKWKISTLVAKSEGSNGNGWALYFDDRSWTHELKFIVGSNAVMTNAIPSPGWYHIAGVYDPSSTPRTKLYLNGIQVADSGVQSGGPAPNDYNVRIGAMNWADQYGGNDRLNGKADEVEFFSRALAAPEIAAIYNAGSAGKCRSCASPPSGMVSWWGGDNNAMDMVGTNNGTLSGATYDLGIVGEAFSFDGVDDYVSISDADFRSNAARTMAFWVNTSDEGVPIVFENTGPLKGALFGRGNHVDQHLHLGIASGKQTLEWYESGHHSIQGTSNIADGNWHHLVFVSDGAGTASLYVDAVLENSGPFFHTSGTTSTRFGSQYEGNGSYKYFFNGLIDEVEFFSRALTASEIAAIYNAGSAGVCTTSYAIIVNAPAGNGNVSCPGSVLHGYPLACTITPDTGYYLSALLDNGGDVLGSVIAGTYTIPGVTEAHTMEATFSEYLIKRVSSSDYYYNLLTEAFGEVNGGDTLMLRQGTFTGSAYDRTGVSITLKGGHPSGFGSNAGQHSTISGQLTISSGTVTVENVTIQ